MPVELVREPESWFIDALPAPFNNELRDAAYHYIVSPEAYMTHRRSLDYFWLVDRERKWWVGVQEVLELGEFEADSCEPGNALTLNTIPLPMMPGFESTWAWLLHDFLLKDHELVPWEKFGLRYEPCSWHSHTVPHPRTDFETWVRKGIRNNYVPHTFGAKSQQVTYTVTADRDAVRDAFVELLPHFMQRWMAYYDERRGFLGYHYPTALSKILAGQETVGLSHTERRLLTISWLESYLHDFLFPLMEVYEAYAVIGRHQDGRVVGMTAGCMTKGCPGRPGPEAHLELIMMRFDDDLKRYSVAPMLFLRFMEEAFWDRGATYVDLMANFDASIDKYKMVFSPETHPYPGLRWTEPHDLYRL